MRIPAIAGTLLVGLTLLSPAEPRQKLDPMDAVTAAPASHTVILENDRVRVLQVTIPPGVTEPIHTHAWPSVMRVESPQPLTYITYAEQGGKMVLVKRSEVPMGTAGKTEWMGPEGLHAVQNRGTSEYRAIRIELKAPLDQFPNYRVSDTFEGRPVPPVLSSPDAHAFRTRIRDGVAKGVVFAGHYEMAVWGCGSGCLSFAVIDACTGKVSFFPATVSQNREAGERLTYRRDSRAIHIIGSLNEEDSADRWYVWDGIKFNLISKRPAILVDDNGDPMKP